MSRALSRTAYFGLLTVLLLATVSSPADTLLVGTSLASPNPGPELCPEASACTYRFSEFSTPQLFSIDDVKVAISGPGFSGPGFSNDGSFNVSIITQPGPSQTVVANVGSNSLVINSLTEPEGSVTQVFDFTGLSITLLPGVAYYLEVTGANVMWDSATPVLSGFGTLGAQLECDPDMQCAQGVARYNPFDSTYAMQISGNAITPEPATWSLMGIGLFSLFSLVYFQSSRNRTSSDLQ